MWTHTALWGITGQGNKYHLPLQKHCQRELGSAQTLIFELLVLGPWTINSIATLEIQFYQNEFHEDVSLSFLRNQVSKIYTSSPIVDGVTRTWSPGWVWPIPPTGMAMTTLTPDLLSTFHQVWPENIQWLEMPGLQSLQWDDYWMWHSRERSCHTSPLSLYGLVWNTFFPHFRAHIYFFPQSQ